MIGLVALDPDRVVAGWDVDREARVAAVITEGAAGRGDWQDRDEKTKLQLMNARAEHWFS
jgi:hypothetical protein